MLGNKLIHIKLTKIKHNSHLVKKKNEMKDIEGRLIGSHRRY
jgi:hypothetical protein